MGEIECKPERKKKTTKREKKNETNDETYCVYCAADRFFTY